RSGVSNTSRKAASRRTKNRGLRLLTRRQAALRGVFIVRNRRSVGMGYRESRRGRANPGEGSDSRVLSRRIFDSDRAEPVENMGRNELDRSRSIYVNRRGFNCVASGRIAARDRRTIRRSSYFENREPHSTFAACCSAFEAKKAASPAHSTASGYFGYSGYSACDAYASRESSEN